MSMTATSSASLNPALATMLAQLSPAGQPGTAMPSVTPPSSAASGNVASVSGSGKAQVSDAILDMFSKLHQAAGGAHHGGGAGGSASAGGSTTTASTASTMMNPLNQLLAAIDSDEDELSTQAQATDPDFTALLSNGS